VKRNQLAPLIAQQKPGILAMEACYSTLTFLIPFTLICGIDLFILLDIQFESIAARLILYHFDIYLC
jgi:hypothetical protein